jgi:hypothetical protein
MLTKNPEEGGVSAAFPGLPGIEKAVYSLMRRSQRLAFLGHNHRLSKKLRSLLS